MTCREFLTLAACLLTLLTLAPASSAASSNKQQRVLRGINLPSGSFNPSGSRIEFDYTYPKEANIDYYTSKGANVIRLSFIADRVVTVDEAGRLIPTTDLEILSNLIDYARSKGVSVILDMHDYGATRTGKLIGRDPGSVEEFAATWEAIAREVTDKPNVIFGLMNEPNRQSAAEWLKGANAAIASIRRVGARQLVLVPGSYWDSANTWTISDNADVMLGVQDPADNFAFEVHQYLDSDNSGTHASAVPGAGASRLAAFTEWARQHNVRGFLGEFGWAANDPAQKEGHDLLCSIRLKQDAWLGWTYWAGGPWWGDYMFSVEPRDGVDRPQMSVLFEFLDPRTAPNCS